MLRTTLTVSLAVIAAFILTSHVSGQTAGSTLIRNAVVLDGTGSPGRRADVRIVGERIARIGELDATPGDQIVDAKGRTLAPGFIDTHSHHDGGLFDALDALGAVSQGITTIVVGQDGTSRYPLAGFLEGLGRRPSAVNVASYVGHGTLRRQVMGTDFRREAADAEIAKMQELLRQEMEVGALGLSTGLEYDPGIYSSTNEIVALARVAASLGGRYISHIRSEDRKLWEAIDEAITVGREAKIPVQISHLKLAMRGLWGQSDRLIQVLDRARANGVQVTADVYPYTYWQSGVTVLFPDRNYDDLKEAEFVLRELVSPDDLLFGRFSPNPQYAGKTLSQIASLRGASPPMTLLALIKEAESTGVVASVVATSMDERDIAPIIRWPFSNISSDGALASAHPRGFGSFPRVLGRYVRQRRVVALEEAVRKMTSLSASNVGLADRGLIVAGQYADLVLFDPETVLDRATTAEPHATSLGIETVWVNGEAVFNSGSTTGKRPGHVLRRSGGR